MPGAATCSPPSTASPAATPLLSPFITLSAAASLLPPLFGHRSPPSAWPWPLRTALQIAGGALGDETKQAEASPMPSASAATTEWSSGSKMENGLALRMIGAVGCATHGDPALNVPLT
uniref:Uncharacterized protein n=1 Tax=Oryza nivara TaxID=4536 RepID=A0A0E0GIN7_ORYNI